MCCECGFMLWMYNIFLLICINIHCQFECKFKACGAAGLIILVSLCCGWDKCCECGICFIDFLPICCECGYFSKLERLKKCKKRRDIPPLAVSPLPGLPGGGLPPQIALSSTCGQEFILQSPIEVAAACDLLKAKPKPTLRLFLVEAKACDFSGELPRCSECEYF